MKIHDTLLKRRDQLLAEIVAEVQARLGYIPETGNGLLDLRTILEMFPDIEEECLLISQINAWVGTGKVILTGDSTLQAMLGATPTGPLTWQDLTYENESVLIWMDTPVFYTYTHADVRHTGLSHETEDPIRWMLWNTPPNGVELQICVGFESGNIVARHWDLDTITNLVSTDFARWGGKIKGLPVALRICIGMLRLLQNAPPSWKIEVERSAAPFDPQDMPHVEIRDSGPAKPKAPRTIRVKNLYMVDPELAHAVRHAIRTGDRLPADRHIVRGHWRNQAVGPKWSQHRMRWIEPHWSGDHIPDIPTLLKIRNNPVGW